MFLLRWPVTHSVCVCVFLPACRASVRPWREMCEVNVFRSVLPQCFSQISCDFPACSVCFSKVSQWARAGRRLRAALHLRREESGWRYATRPPWKPLMHERTSPSPCRSLALTRFTFGCEHWTLFVKYLIKKCSGFPEVNMLIYQTMWSTNTYTAQFQH